MDTICEVCLSLRVKYQTTNKHESLSNNNNVTTIIIIIIIRKTCSPNVTLPVIGSVTIALSSSLFHNVLNWNKQYLDCRPHRMDGRQ